VAAHLLIEEGLRLIHTEDDLGHHAPSVAFWWRSGRGESLKAAAAWHVSGFARFARAVDAAAGR
jgi:hypothetical protein